VKGNKAFHFHQDSTVNKKGAALQAKKAADDTLSSDYK
jgi:hypothetical protein